MAVYSSKVMNESAVTMAEAAVNPFQYFIDTQREDLKLFSAVIEADFAEVYSEAGLSPLTESDIACLLEAEGNKIMEKINEIVDRFKAWVHNLITKFLATVDSLFRNDAALIKKYAKYVNKEKCAGCPAAQETIDEEVYNQFINHLKGMITRAEIVAVNDQTKDSLAKESATLQKLIEEKATKIMKNADKKAKLVDVVNFTAMVDSMNGAGKKSKEEAVKFKNTANATMANAKVTAKSRLGSAESKEGNVALNEIYKSVVGLSNLVSKACTLYVKFAGKRVAVYRKNYITLGAWALRNDSGKVAEAPKAEDQTTNESVSYDEIQATLLEMASDEYTDELFSLAF